MPYAVLGSPVNHSLSPVMQQAAFDHAGLEARYYRIEVDDAGLEEAVTRMRQVPFGGWNCTIPNKVKMYELCDHRAESAEQFRAVNTVVNEGGVLTGHNTGRRGLDPGAEGCLWPQSGRLAHPALGRRRGGARHRDPGGPGKMPGADRRQPQSPARARVARPPERAVLHRTAGPHAGKSPRRPVERTGTRSGAGEVDLVVNATSAGLDPKSPPILPARILPASLLVLDTVYGAGCEKFRREVETAGSQVERRLGDAPAPGRGSLHLWTGRDAPLKSCGRR